MKLTGNEPAMPMDFSIEGYSMQKGLTIRQKMATDFTATFVKDYPILEAVDLGIKAADELIEALNNTPNPNV